MLKVPCLGLAAAHCPGLLGRALRPPAVTDSVRAGAQWEAVSAGRSRRCCGLAHPQAHVVVASAADDDEAVVAGDVAAVEVTRLTKICPPPPHTHSPTLPPPLPASSPQYGSLTHHRRPCSHPRRWLPAPGVCACARGGALRECHITPPPTPWQMNHATLSDEEGEEVYVVVACEAE